MGARVVVDVEAMGDEARLAGIMAGGDGTDEE